LAFFGKTDAPPPAPSPVVPDRNPQPPPIPAAAPPSPTPSPGSAIAATTVIGSKMKVVGDVSGDEDVLVNGRIEGKIRVDRKVVVSPGAEVEGDVQARAVIVGGRVHGQVMASERAELLASGRVQGNVHSPRIVMAEGAQIQGRVVMPNDAAMRPISSSGSRPEVPRTEAPRAEASRTEESAKRPLVPPPPKTEDPARRPVAPSREGG
jgi:cytoskeletal protein CcmA (bactofilin family)